MLTPPVLLSSTSSLRLEPLYELADIGVPRLDLGETASIEQGLPWIALLTAVADQRGELVPVVGVPRKHARQRLDGGLPSSGFVEGHRMHVPVTSVLRGEAGGRLQLRHCLGQAPLPHEQQAKGMVRRGAARI